jgi:uncharacterized protein YqeY
MGHNVLVSKLKDQLKADLATSIKARDELTSSTIRLSLTAISTAETSGKQARELADEEVVEIIVKEAKRRREAAEAYDEANRPELAAREREELSVLERYLPTALSEAEIDSIIAVAVAEATAAGATGPRAMGDVMKLVTPQVKGRSDGGAVAAKVKAALAPAQSE